MILFFFTTILVTARLTLIWQICKCNLISLIILVVQFRGTFIVFLSAGCMLRVVRVRGLKLNLQLVHSM